MKRIIITDTEDGNTLLDLEAHSYVLFTEESDGLCTYTRINAAPNAILAFAKALLKANSRILSSFPTGEAMPEPLSEPRESVEDTCGS